MGDFNATLDALDSSNPGRMGSVELLSWASMTRLNELRRNKNPMDRCYSHLLQSHRSSARIDLAFGNPALLPFLQGIEYLAGVYRAIFDVVQTWQLLWAQSLLGGPKKLH